MLCYRFCSEGSSLIFAVMLVQTAPIQGLRRTDYDTLLGMGWFRGTGIIYRSEFVCIEQQVYGIRNIRFPVQDFTMRRSHSRLYRRNLRKFTIKLGTPHSDARREQLYRGQLSRFKAFVHESLEDILLSPRMGAEIDAMEISVFDGDKLIAVSYLDVGESSMASILCLFDPAYGKYSPGTFTMLLELDMAKRLGLDYYYPGYVLDLPSAFDYKLALGPCQWLHKEEGWQWKMPLNETGKAALLRSKMRRLEQLIIEQGFYPGYRVYPYYTLGHLLQDRTDLVKVPVFYSIQCGIQLLGIAFDIERNAYVGFDLHAANELDHLHQLQLSDDYKYGDSYMLQTLCFTFCDVLSENRFADDFLEFLNNRTHTAVVGA